jgi:predicted RNase H-like HicB family nuclease
MVSPPFKVPKYPISVYWSEPDELFIAKVPDLPGCMADGASYQEAVSNAEVVIRGWIETARDLGREIPRPSRAPVALS